MGSRHAAGAGAGVEDAVAAEECSTLAALSPDIQRFALGVGGSNFPLMMPRNARWPEIELLYSLAYPRRLDRDLLRDGATWLAIRVGLSF